MAERYGVIGNPIRHSKSPAIHSAFASAAGVDMEYGLIECSPDAFVRNVESFRADGGRGLNVTAPFKLEAFDLCDIRSDRAVTAGSVNTLRFRADGIDGENFDGIGLVRDLRVNLARPIAGARVLVLGAGGAARGIVQPLAEEIPRELVVANRTPDRARAVAALVDDASVRGGSLEELGDEPFDIVINATSASMMRAAPPIPASVFMPDSLAYDLAYGLGMTPFLAMANEAGVRHRVDGVGMLVEQAAESFLWWWGIRPRTDQVIASMTLPLV